MRSKTTGKFLSTVSVTATAAEIGAGGFICGFKQAPDGWLVMSPDVISPCIRGPNDKRWRFFFTIENLGETNLSEAPSALAPDGLGGPAMLAPSNSAIGYAYRNGHYWRTTDHAATVTKRPAGPFHIRANTGSSRYANPLIDIHPTNPDVVLIGTNDYAADRTKSGAFFTTDGFSTATKITGLANPASRTEGEQTFPSRTLVHIDPGQPTIAYAHVEGTGLYRCDTFPSATGWSLIASSPLFCHQLNVLADGTVLMACGGPYTVVTDGNDIYRQTRAGVATYLKSLAQGAGCSVVAANPANTNIILAANPDGNTRITFDGGATAFKYYDGFDQPNPQVGSGEIKWLSDQGVKTLTMGQIGFDKTVANQAIAAHGFGISKATIATASGGSLIWHDFTAGLEEKVARCGYHAPGFKMLLGNWDIAFTFMDRQGDYSNTPIQPPRNDTTALTIAMNIADAADDPNYRIAAIGQQQRNNVESFDGGRSWTKLANQTGMGMGGAVACNRKLNSIILDTNNGGGFYTLDGWETKQPIRLDGVNVTVNFINALFVLRKPIAADKTRPGAFALVTSISASPALAGFHLSLDGGVSWEKKIAGPIGSNLPGWNSATNDNRDFWACQLEAVPGFTKEWLYTPHADYPADYFMHITNDDTVARLGANVTNVACFDFGPIAPGQTRPSVIFYGRVNGVSGAYYSEDWFATDPLLMARYPLRNLSTPVVVRCDKEVLGTAYFGAIGWEKLTLGQRLQMKAS